MSSYDAENPLFYMYLLLRIPHFNQTCLFGFKENSSATPCPSMNILEQSRMQRIFFAILSLKNFLPLSWILIIILKICFRTYLLIVMGIFSHKKSIIIENRALKFPRAYSFSSCISKFQLRLHLTLTSALISNQN